MPISCASLAAACLQCLIGSAYHAGHDGMQQGCRRLNRRIRRNGCLADQTELPAWQWRFEQRSMHRSQEQDQSHF